MKRRDDMHNDTCNDVNVHNIDFRPLVTSDAERCSAMRCGAVPCRAVLARVRVHRFVHVHISVHVLSSLDASEGDAG